MYIYSNGQLNRKRITAPPSRASGCIFILCFVYVGGSHREMWFGRYAQHQDKVLTRIARTRRMCTNTHAKHANNVHLPMAKQITANNSRLILMRCGESGNFRCEFRCWYGDIPMHWHASTSREVFEHAKTHTHARRAIALCNNVGEIDSLATCYGNVSYLGFNSAQFQAHIHQHIHHART